MSRKATRYAQVLAWIDQHVIHPFYTERMRRLILQSLPFWVASILTGLAAVGYEKIFVLAESLSFAWLSQEPLLAFLLTPAAFFISWFLVDRLAPAARGSGIPQVMAGIELSHPKTHGFTAYLLSLKVAWVKILSSGILLLGGGVIGREGPTIQISAAIFRAINRLQPSGWPQLSRQIALITGGAAGLAAAFNTPLGGIVFVVEELTQTHITRYRTAVFTAVIIAGITAQAILGPYLYLGFPKVNASTGWILGVIGGVSILCGLAGALLAKTLLVVNSYRQRFGGKIGQIGWVIGCGVVLAVMAFGVGTDAVGTGKPIINRLLFENNDVIPYYLFPIRFAGMVVSYCGGGAGGVFATSLSTGAVLGESLCQLLDIAPVHRNLLILVSMVSFLTGVVRSPFTAAILVLEMTDRHSAIFQLLLGGLVAQGAASLIDRTSFYEHLKVGFVREAMTHSSSPSSSTEENGNPNQPVV